MTVTEEIESGARGDAVDQIDQRLHQQLPADTSARLVKRLRRDGQLAVPELTTFEQHEDDHRERETGRSHRTNYRTEPREAREPRALVRGDHDGPRGRSSGHIRFSKVGLDVLDRPLQLLDRSPFAGASPSAIFVRMFVR
jgi:hypothetical protein